MKKYNADDVFVLWFRRFCSFLGLGFFLYSLFWFGEYLADYHFTATVNTYCTIALTVCVAFLIHGVKPVVKKQLKDEKKRKNEKLLTYHKKHHHNHYY